MIQLSKFPFKTSKTMPKVSDNKSTGLLLQAGFIRQTMAGVYTYTTLGQRIYNNIENIVREEMDSVWAFETKMPNLSPKEFWDQTNRWNIDVLFHVPATNNKEYALNCTHEEIVTPLLGDFIQSYKDLPTCAYQIQYKFRNEKRAKSGLLRGREFIMKDAYSFHASDEDFVEYYEKMKEVYMKIFERLWLWKDTFIALADGGTFTEKYSHEFQVRLEIGEDTIYTCQKCWLSHNEEVISVDSFKCLECRGGKYKKFSASEIWNIFPLETKFSKAFGLTYSDENNKAQTPIMGCYWIGVSRAMWIVAEYFMTEKWINWPAHIAPANYYIIVLWEENVDKAQEISINLEKQWKTVILDDRMGRKFWFWQKAWDCELWWIPNRIVISPKTLEKWGYELRKQGEKEVIITL